MHENDTQQTTMPTMSSAKGANGSRAPCCHWFAVICCLVVCFVVCVAAGLWQLCSNVIGQSRYFLL